MTGEDILPSHRESVIQRCRSESTVLLVQGTTALRNIGWQDWPVAPPNAQGELAGTGALGVHAGLAVTEDGCPLGLFSLRLRPCHGEIAATAASPELSSEPCSDGYDQAVELGRACPGTRVAMVSDCERGIQELFRRQANETAMPELLVRACREGDPLLASMRASDPVARDRVVSVAARRGNQVWTKRSARSDVRVRRVPFPPSGGHLGTVSAQAVLVTEPSPPAGSRPLEWLLLSSDGAPTEKDALRSVARYERRRLIEEFFKVFKCGMQLLDPWMAETESTETTVASVASNAWKVFDIARSARERPEVPASNSFTGVEIDVLNRLLNAERIFPPALRGQPPPVDVRTTVLNLARVAGFRPTKRQPFPGVGTVWKAWKVLKPMVRWERARRAQAKLRADR